VKEGKEKVGASTRGGGDGSGLKKEEGICRCSEERGVGNTSRLFTGNGRSKREPHLRREKGKKNDGARVRKKKKEEKVLSNEDQEKILLGSRE